MRFSLVKIVSDFAVRTFKPRFSNSKDSVRFSYSSHNNIFLIALHNVTQNLHRILRKNKSLIFHPCLVNIGLEKDGLIHISKTQGRELHPNQPVKVQIESIQGDRVSLRLVKTL